MDQNNELHQLIAKKLHAEIPPEFEEQMLETLNNLDEEDTTLVIASRHLAQLAVEHEDMMLHYAATAVLWITGLLNVDDVVTPDDVRVYAYRTWQVIQQALSEIVDEGLEAL